MSNLSLSALVNAFWLEVASNFKSNQKFRIQAQFKIGNSFRSMSYIQILDNSNESKDIFIKLLINKLEKDSSNYLDIKVDELFLRYKIIKNKNVPITINNNPNDMIPTTPILDNYHNLNIPNTMNIFHWYENVQFINKNAAFFTKEELNYSFLINDNNNEIKTRITDLNNKTIVEFVDIKEVDDTTFTRQIKGKTLAYINGVNVSSYRNDTKFIQKLAKDKVLSLNVITMDLETKLNKDNVMNPVSVAIYDGTEYKTYFITDYNNSVDMLNESVKNLLQSKYNNHHIYLHNFSKFDGIFLLKIIANLDGKIKILIRDNNLISISVKFEVKLADKTRKCVIYFHDSLLLLPASLEKLALFFNVERKGSFNFNRINIAKTRKQLNLIKSELLSYNKQDCLVLYQVIHKFANEIFKLYSLNLTNYPTLSSLSFAIFRSNFMKEENIPISNLNDFNFIKESYRGGHVDVYRPFTKGKRVYCYDINSLYPSVMAKNPFPVGIPKYFNGTRDLKDLFGFVKVVVTCPDMFCPVLLTKHNNKTIAPIGSWTGVYFSEELKYAQTLGYEFEILEGVTFDKANIFEEFITNLYDQRLNYPKSDPRNLIAKLLMNTSYGKFGMSLFTENFSLITKDNLDEAFNFLDSVDLGNKLLITTGKFRNVNNTDRNMMQVSTGIASAVTAYSRIEINKLKIQFAENLLYSDTDSIFTDIKLSEDLINNKLGGLKLEYILEDAVFLAPKVYGGIMDNGKEISKVKGFSKPVNFKDLKSLLIRNKSLELNHDKWFRDFSSGIITIKDSLYNLVVSSNKRKNIYINNKFIGTKPIKLKN
jgi:DNA polymerase type B, organellar and viral